MLRMSRRTSIALEVALVASPNQVMKAIQVSRKKPYELIKTGELESYTEGKSRLRQAPTGRRSGSARPRCLPWK